MFWIEGKLSGSDVIRRVTWRNGELGGDELAGYRIRQYIKEQARLDLTIGLPTGPKLPAARALSTGLTAVCAIGAVLSITGSGGDLPKVPPIPEGAEA